MPRPATAWKCLAIGHWQCDRGDYSTARPLWGPRERKKKYFFEEAAFHIRNLRLAFSEAGTGVEKPQSHDKSETGLCSCPLSSWVWHPSGTIVPKISVKNRTGSAIRYPYDGRLERRFTWASISDPSAQTFGDRRRNPNDTVFEVPVPQCTLNISYLIMIIPPVYNEEMLSRCLNVGNSWGFIQRTFGIAEKRHPSCELQDCVIIFHHLLPWFSSQFSCPRIEADCSSQRR